ncbi:MAG: endo-1,4-beta-xylanase [Mediterranea sp.]|nr:endo-1,4-beta-xylanase [Mediterranea sp.]
MKRLSYRYTAGAFLLAAAALATTSCVDDEVVDYKVEKPASIANMEYLNDYDALKTYVAAGNPDFKLGAGVNAETYNQQGLAYRVINENFVEVVAGNAMKYSSVVNDKGEMNFGTVSAFVEAAKTAGMSVYGHTLVWHSQQTNKYLNGLLADKPVEGGDVEYVLHVVNPTAVADQPWTGDLYYDLPAPLTAGVTYTLTLDMKASEAMSIGFWPETDGSAEYFSSFNAATTWLPVSINFTPANNITTLRWVFGNYAGEFSIDNAVLTAAGSEDNLIANSTFDDGDMSGWRKSSWNNNTVNVAQETAAASWWENLVNNSDCESDDDSSYRSTENGVGPTNPRFSDPGTGAGGVGRAIVVTTGASHTNNWDTQFFVTTSHVFEAGDAFRFSMMMRADKPVTFETQAHAAPGGYLHWSMVGNPSVTTEWTEYTYSGAIPAEAAGAQTIAFNLAMSDNTTYYFDDIKWEIEKTGGVPLTPEEKADTLTWALNNWMAGMMEATGGYVTAWDVVNEPISGSDGDGDGKYDLWSATNAGSGASSNFYWQDYLGDTFVRTAVKLARENSTVPLKLFVNDYNLESDWDNNKKLESLIKWIEYWESDGVTVVDGIGTQMHVSYYENPASQASKEAAITRMFELMAATGKLVKVSELDMGCVDASGSTVMTPALTDEQARGMSDFYKFIVKEYFRIIPAAQQYGITQWATTDSPAGSGWRGGEPIGLWTENYATRKHAYAGFADGLAGK